MIRFIVVNAARRRGGGATAEFAVRLPIVVIVRLVAVLVVVRLVRVLAFIRANWILTFCFTRDEPASSASHAAMLRTAAMAISCCLTTTVARLQVGTARHQHWWTGRGWARVCMQLGFRDAILHVVVSRSCPSNFAMGDLHPRSGLPGPRQRRALERSQCSRHHSHVFALGEHMPRERA